MPFLLASLHNLITFSSFGDALFLYGAAFGTGAGLTATLCFFDIKTKRLK